MSELGVQLAHVEEGSCDRCPLAKRPGFLGRLLGVRPNESVFSYCAGRGPERVVLSGAVEVDYRTGSVNFERNETLVCPKDLTPEQRRASMATESLIYDRFEEAHAEFDRRQESPDAMTDIERMALTQRWHIPSAKQ